MAADFKTINTKLIANPAPMKQGLDKALSDLQNFSSKAGGFASKAIGGNAMGAGADMFGAIMGQAKAALGPIGAVATGLEMVGKAAKAGFDMAIEQGEKALAMQKSANLIGFTGSGRAAFDVMGGSEKGAELAEVIPKMNKLIGEAAMGSDEAAKKLQKLGMTVQEAASSTPEDNFKRIADTIAGMPSKAERTAAAMEAFGKSGAQFLPMLEKGAKGFSDAQKEAIDRGMAPPKQLVEATEQFKKAKRALEQTNQGMWTALATGFAPFIKSAANFITMLSNMQKGFTKAINFLTNTDPKKEQEAQRKKNDAEAKKSAEAFKRQADADTFSAIDTKLEGMGSKKNIFGEMVPEAKSYRDVLKDLTDKHLEKTTQGMEKLAKAAAKMRDAMDVHDLQKINDVIGKDTLKDFTMDMNRAKEFLGDGQLSKGNFGKYSLKMLENLEHQFPELKSVPNLSSGLSQDSAEAASFVLKAQNQPKEKSIAERWEAAQQRMAEQEERTAKAAEEIANYLTNKDDDDDDGWEIVYA